MNREVIDSLFSLFDKRVAHHIPRQIGRDALDALERLVDRNRPDRHRRVPKDPFARRVNV